MFNQSMHGRCTMDICLMRKPSRSDRLSKLLSPTANQKNPIQCNCKKLQRIQAFPSLPVIPAQVWSFWVEFRGPNNFSQGVWKPRVLERCVFQSGSTPPSLFASVRCIFALWFFFLCGAKRAMSQASHPRVLRDRMVREGRILPPRRVW